MVRAIGGPTTIVSEIVPGALAEVTNWERIHTDKTISFWKAKPPSPDYVALSNIISHFDESSTSPPENLTKGFRLVHKSVVEPFTLTEKDRFVTSLGGASFWATGHGVLYSFTPGEKPLDEAYRLKLSETKAYSG